MGRGDNIFPHSFGEAPLSTLQDTAGHLCYQVALDRVDHCWIVFCLLPPPTTRAISSEMLSGQAVPFPCHCRVLVYARRRIWPLSFLYLTTFLTGQSFCLLGSPEWHPKAQEWSSQYCAINKRGESCLLCVMGTGVKLPSTQESPLCSPPIPQYVPLASRQGMAPSTLCSQPHHPTGVLPISLSIHPDRNVLT